MNTYKTLVSSLRSIRALRSISAIRALAAARAFAGASLALFLAAALSLAPAARAYTVSGSTLTISGSDDITNSFGTLSNVTFAAGGTIAIGPGLDIAFDSAGDVTNHLAPSTAVPVSFYVDENSTLTFSNNSVTTNGGALFLNTNGATSKLFLMAAASGTYLFENNLATGGNGGAIANNANNGYTEIWNARFEGNRATGGNGGGALFTSANSGTIMVTNALFISNTADSNGGAFAANQANSLALTFNNVTFTDNYSGTGNGGAAYIQFNNTAATYKLSSVVFITNTAAVGSGGAIDFTFGSVAQAALTTTTLTDASFLGNYAGVRGGAIWYYGGVMGYTVNTSATFAGNKDSAGNNGIYMANTAPTTLNFTIAGELDMLDPMASAATAQTLAINKTGAGLWNLGGDNALAIGAASTFAVQGGELHLYRYNETNYNSAPVTAGKITFSGAGASTFSLSGGATLSAGGGNSITASTISLANNSTLALDLGFFADPSNKTATLLSFNATNPLGATWSNITLNLLNLAALDAILSPGSDDSATFNLIALSGGSTFADTTFANAISLPDGYSLKLGGGDTILQLLYGEESATLNRVLTWTGVANDGSWHGANWTADATVATGNDTFTKGDIVNLAGAPATATATAIDLGAATTGTIGGMYVSGNQSYTLTGGGIAAGKTADFSDLAGSPAVTGKLVLGALAPDNAGTPITTAFSGVLDFTQLTSNSFAGGVELDSGALRIATTAQLGAPLSSLFFLGTPGAATTGTLLIAGDITFDGSAGAGGLLAITAGKSGAIALESGKTATFANNTAGAINVALGSNLTLDAGDGASYVFSNNAITGNGAAINIVAGAGTVSLTNVSFLDNHATGSGGAIYFAGTGSTTIAINVGAGMTSRYAGNMDTSGANPNSIYINYTGAANSLASVNIFVDAGGTLDMLDPIMVNCPVNSTGAQFVKTGAGVWNLAGSSTFSKLGNTNNAVYAGITVSEGMLYLYGAKDAQTPVHDPVSGKDYPITAASINFYAQNNNGLTTFAVKAGGTLGIGGGNTITYSSGAAVNAPPNFSIDPGAVFDFKLDNTTKGADQTAMLTVDTHILNVASNKIVTNGVLNPIISLDLADFSQITAGDTYNLISLTAPTNTGFDTITDFNAMRGSTLFSGMTIGEFNSTYHLTVNYGVTDDTMLWVTFADFLASNKVVTWTGANASLWQNGDWVLASDNSPSAFANGDIVSLAPTADADANNTNTITLDAATTATAAGISVFGGQNYAIDGAGTLGIAADAASAGDSGMSGAAALGKLTLGAQALSTAALDTTAAFTGTLDLTKTAGNTFAGGVDIYSGVLLISDAGQLGTTLSGLNFKAAPGAAPATLRVADGGDVAFDNGAGLSNRLVVADAKAADFVLEDGATLTFANNNLTSTAGAAINSGTGANLTFEIGAGARLDFSKNRTTGGNNTGDGGAIQLGTGANLAITAGDGGFFLFESNSIAARGGAIFGYGANNITVNSGTFANNIAGTNGGGIATVGGGTVTVSNVVFTSNTAVIGGGIFGNTGPQILVQSSTFDHNYSTGATANTQGGGAVGIQGNTDATGTITLRDVAFTNNGAASVGGAVYMGTYNNTLIIERALFDSNTAAVGGAVGIASGATSPYLASTLTDVIFTNNAASTNGGAISIGSAGAPSLTLNVSDGGQSLFAQNTQGAAATPNSIYMSSTVTLNVNVGNAGSLDMVDPMTAANTPVTITKTGLGVWNLGGNNDLNASAASTFTISTGTLHLYGAAEHATGPDGTEYPVSATGVGAGKINMTGGTFTLASNAVLSAGGGNTITAPTITLGDTSILTLDLTGAAPAAPDGTGYSVLTLNAGAGLLASTWTQTLNLLNLDTLASNSGDTYNLITLGNGNLFTTDNLASLAASAASSLTTGYQLQLADGNNGILQLLFFQQVDNNVLNWTGANGSSWSASNWALATDGLTEATFAKGDIINLADDTVDASISAPTTTTLNVDTTTSATIAGMYLSGTTSYTVTGAGITADAAVGSLSGSAAATGQLILGAIATDADTLLTADPLQPSIFSPSAFFSGTLTLDNAANTFTAGIVINSGELVGNAANLAVGEGAGILDNGALTFNQLDDATYAAPISGNGALNKTGAGALTLTAANTLTGLTTINAGALLLANAAGAASLAGDITVNDTGLLGGDGTAGASVTINTGGSLMAGLTHGDNAITAPEILTIADALKINAGATLLFDLYGNNTSDRIDAGSLVVVGTGTIDINNPISGTYTLINTTSGVDLTGGAFAVTKNGDALTGRVAAHAYAATSDTQLWLEVAVTNISSTWTGAAGNTLWSTDAANWANPTDTVFYNGDAVIFNPPDATTVITVAPAGVTAVSMTVDLGAVSYYFTGGPITTSTANTSLAADPTLATGKLIKQGTGLLSLNNTGTNNFEEGIVIQDGSLVGNVDTLHTGSNGINIILGTLVFSQSTAGTYSSTITGAGNLVKSGLGNLTLDGVTDYSGYTGIQDAGALILANADQIASSQAVSFSGGGTLNTGANAQTLNKLSGVGNIVTGAGTLTLNNANAFTDDTIFPGNISGGASITKTGAGALELGGTNTFAGSLTVAQGSLALSYLDGARPLPQTADITINSGATLQFSDMTVSTTVPNTFAGAGSIVKNSANILTLTANSSAFTGTINITAGSLILANNASLGGQLNLADATALAGAGALGNVTTLGSATITIGALNNTNAAGGPETLALTGTLTLAGNTTLFYDVYSANTSDLITAAALVRNGSDTININLGDYTSGTYTLVTTRETIADTANLGAISNGKDLIAGGGRTSAVFDIVSGTNLELILTSHNVTGLKWDGINSGTWQQQVTNWKTDDVFLNGDAVIFDDTAAGAHAVTIAATGVQVVDMTVTTGSAYTFTGGAIRASSTVTSSVTGSGALTINGTGLVTLANATGAANTFDGGINIASGTLQGNTQTLGATTATILNNGALVFDQATAATYNAAITGTGLMVMGASSSPTATLTLSNAANQYTGGINVLAGSLSLANPTDIGAITISTGAALNLATPSAIGAATINGALNITTASDITIANAITGAGLLSIDAAGHAVGASLATPSAFTGTIALANSTFDLAANANLVRNATLSLGAGNITTAGSTPTTIGNLALNGGKLIFDTTIPADLAAPGQITATALALGASGTIQVNTPTATPSTAAQASLFAQAAGATVDKLITATTVTGNTALTGIALVDQTGASLATASATAAIAQGAAGNVATGAYTYKLTTVGGASSSPDGLYVNYALTALTIDTGKTLALAPAAGDTGAFNALISGNGNLSIDATVAPVTLGAAGGNNFTGTTTVTSGTLIAGVSNALGGATNALVLSSGSGGVNAAFNLNGQTQTLATLNTDANTTVNLANGALTVANGAINGALAGAGALNVTGGNLTINFANTAMTAATTIAASSTVTASTLQSLGTGDITLAGPAPANTAPAKAALTTLALGAAAPGNAGVPPADEGRPDPRPAAAAATPDQGVLIIANTAPGTLANAIKGGGSLNLNGAAPTTIDHANPAFTGQTAVNGPVTAADPAALGTGAITIGDANPNATLTYTAPGVIANNIGGANGTLNLAAAGGDGDETTLTGNNTVGTINALAGSNIVAAGANSLASARLNMTDATVTLAAPNATLGAVTMNGASTLGFAKTLAPGGTLNLASLKSTGAGATLSLNTDIAAGKIDRLALATAADGDFNLALNNTGAEPAITGTGGIDLNFIDHDKIGAASFTSTDTITGDGWMYDYNTNFTLDANNNGSLNISQGEMSGAGSEIIANATGAMPLTWFAELDTLSKRLGDLHIAPRETPGLDVWARAYAQRINVNAKDTLVPFAETQYGTEVGADYGGRPTGYGAATYVGIFAGYGASRRDIHGISSNADVTSAYAGIYATFITPDGWYLDLAGKYNHFQNEFSYGDNGRSVNGNYNNDAIGASVEAGKRIELKGNWSVTPGAQAALVRIDGQDYTANMDGAPRAVRLGETTSRQIRAGAQLAYKFTTKDAQVIQPYAKAYLAQQWTTGGLIQVQDATFAPTIKGARIDAGIGVNWQMMKTLQVYLDYETAWARDYTKPYGLTLGANYAW